MLKLPPGIDYEHDPLDVCYRRNLRGLVRRFKLLYDAIYDRLGDEGLELIRGVSAEYGREIAQRVLEREGAMDLKQAGMFIVKVFDNMRTDGEVLLVSDDKVAITIPECPYPMSCRELCEAHITMEKNLVEGLNPDAEFAITECIAAGDPRCVYEVRRKIIE